MSNFGSESGSMVSDNDPIHLISDTSARQMRAATPELSAWVSANAGSGKTHVLSRRVVRLLLKGARPSAILCLTYTKAAAAEMSNRIFKILVGWSQMDDEALSEAIYEMENKQPNQATLRNARQLFASALETPGGLKIQTIHAFCEALLHRFPLEANVAGHFTVLDDHAAKILLDQSRQLLMNEVRVDKNIADAIQEILDIGGEFGLVKLLDDIITKRSEFHDFLSKSEQARASDAIPFPQLSEALDINPDENEDEILAGIWPLPDFPEHKIKLYQTLAQADKAKTPQKIADIFIKAQNAPDHKTCYEVLRGGFLTKSGTVKAMKAAASKYILSEMDDALECLNNVANYILSIEDKMRRQSNYRCSVQALIIAKRFLSIYERLKRRQAKLDYDDLISGTASLLKKKGAGAWVHYKLDQGIDHILVDEAQDTGPEQWDVIQSLASEFFSGETARNYAGSDVNPLGQTNRTVFAVGDEKQSIYSFQGARPERFDQERRATQAKAGHAQKPFESINLRVSFRSTAEILSMVDLVFGDEDAAKGISLTGEAIEHQTVRNHAPGCVELWEMQTRSPTEEDDSWTAPYDAVSEQSPVMRLAQQIALVFEDWIGKKPIYDDDLKKFRPIRAGDILILVRKRDAFVPTLMRVLKTQTNIAVAGADRLRLTDHIAVQDLIALGRAVLMPEDDLSLAALLKSPFFGFDEEQLFEIAAKRDETHSLYMALKHVKQNAHIKNALMRFEQLRHMAQELSVHDFYAHILGPQKGRSLYLGILGYEVLDVLDEFLAAALDHDQNNLPGLQGFLLTLEQANPDIKREQEQDIDAIRIMTVHASKGLEAPIVFLVDPGSAAFHASHLESVRLVEAPDHHADRAPCPIWVPSSNVENSVTNALKDTAERLAEEEYRRLLYVGLTRAADRLIICGYRGEREPKKPTWHGLVAGGFSRAEEQQVSNVTYQIANTEWSAQRYILNHEPHKNALQTASKWSNAETQYRQSSGFKLDKPAILNEPLAKPPRLPRPLAPSRTSAIIERENYNKRSGSPFGRKTDTKQALKQGNVVHRLLQVLPDKPAHKWHDLASQYALKTLPDMAQTDRTELVIKVLNVLNDETFTDIFSQQGQAEVSIMGHIRLNGERRAITGYIDRLIVKDDHVLIIDYKSNQTPPTDINGVPENYIAQLALYCHVLKNLYDEKLIKAALLYTYAPLLIPIPEDRLNNALDQLGVIK